MRRTRQGALCWCVLSALAAVAAAAQFDWSELPELPVAHGFGGPAVGHHNGAILLAGGANFPERPPWEGGEKVWYDQIWFLDLESPDETAGPRPEGGAGPRWRRAGTLERPLAYAACVSTAEGVLLVGGDDGVDVSREVLRLRYERGDGPGRVSVERLPPLPRATTYAAAAVSGRRVYVAAGRDSMDAADLYKAFWSLDLDDLEAGWTVHEPYPGPARIKMVAAAQSNGNGAPSEAVYLFSGEAQAAGRPTYTTEAWAFDPAGGPAGAWRPVAALPQPVAAGAAVPLGEAHVAVFSGSTGRFVHLPPEENPLFPTTVLGYHTLTDTWTEVGDLPQGVVTTPAFLVGGDAVLVSGEIRPGVRTTHGFRGRLAPQRRTLGPLNLVFVAGYLLLLVAMGIFFSRRNRGTGDFFLAGRRVPWWAAGLSIYATQLSAITFLGAPAITFAGDWVVAPSWLMILAVAPVIVAFFLPFFRRQGVITAYEYLDRRFGLGARLFGSASFIVFQLARMAVVIYLPALALQAMTGIDVSICIVTAGVLATLYTVAGGMEAVVWTDVLQSFVLLGGLLLCLVLVVSDLGGAGTIYAAAAAAGKTTLFNWSLSATELATWSVLIGSFLLNLAPYATDQAVVQRYLTTRDERSAARGIWLNAVLSVPFAMLFLCLGTALWLYFKQRPELLELGMQNDQTFPLFIVGRLPEGAAGLLIAGILAASMSSLDSSIHSISTALSHDFFKRFGRLRTESAELGFARTVVVAAGTVATVTALVLASFDVRSLFFFFQSLLGLLSSSVVAIFLLGVFTRRAHQTGALLGAAASTAALAWATFWTDMNLYVYPMIGIGTGVFVGYLMSRLIPGPATAATGMGTGASPAP